MKTKLCEICANREGCLARWFIEMSGDDCASFCMEDENDADYSNSNRPRCVIEGTDVAFNSYVLIGLTPIGATIYTDCSVKQLALCIASLYKMFVDLLDKEYPAFAEYLMRYLLSCVRDDSYQVTIDKL